MSVFYFIHPGDDRIHFEAPFNLTDLKHLHNIVMRRLQEDEKQGRIITPYANLSVRLDRLIQQLESEYYPK